MKCVIYRGIEILHNATRSHQMKSNFLNFLGGNPQTPPPSATRRRMDGAIQYLITTNFYFGNPPLTPILDTPLNGGRVFFFLGGGGGCFHTI